MYGTQQYTDMAAVRKQEPARHLTAIGAGDRVDGVGTAQNAADGA
jgi:hypothetical protein